jgi:hypothetical protein
LIGYTVYAYSNGWITDASFTVSLRDTLQSMRNEFIAQNERSAGEIADRLRDRVTSARGIFLSEEGYYLFARNVAFLSARTSITLREASPGWNLVSVPRIPASYRPDSVFADNVPTTLYGFNGAYFIPTLLETGPGYWGRFDSAGPTTVRGTSVNQIAVTVPGTGWTLIGSLPYRVPATNLTSDPPGMIMPGTLYGFEGRYIPASELEPGKAYWVRVTGPCTLRLTR